MAYGRLAFVAGDLNGAQAVGGPWSFVGDVADGRASSWVAAAAVVRCAPTSDRP